MKNLNKLLIPLFYIANLVLITLYLYPGSVLGCYLYNDCLTQPKITSDIIISSKYSISSNHFWTFTIFSVLGFFTYQDKKKIKFLIIYLLLLSIILELLHIVVPIRAFEWKDLSGNILGVIFIIIIYKIKNKYA